MTFRNPYLDEFNAANGSDLYSGYEARQKLTQKYAWAVPSEEAVRAIAFYGPVVEIGAGTGYWASLLRQVGTDVVAYDRDLSADNHWCVSGLHSLVELGGPEKASEHPDRTLFLCWPPYDTPMADDCLAAYEAAGGRTFAYVGEYRGGCTGDDAFHERIDAGWESERLIDIPRWGGIHDYLWVYRRVSISG